MDLFPTTTHLVAQVRAAELETACEKARVAAEQANSVLLERDAFWTGEVKQLRGRLDDSQREVRVSQKRQHPLE